MKDKELREIVYRMFHRLKALEDAGTEHSGNIKSSGTDLLERDVEDLKHKKEWF